MTAKTLVQLTCNEKVGERQRLECGASVVLDVDSRTFARLEAQSLGWKTIQTTKGFVDFCPEHDPVKAGKADDACSSRTTARMKGYMEQRHGSTTKKSNPRKREQ